MRQKGIISVQLKWQEKLHAVQIQLKTVFSKSASYSRLDKFSADVNRLKAKLVQLSSFGNIFKSDFYEKIGRA